MNVALFESQNQKIYSSCWYRGIENRGSETGKERIIFFLYGLLNIRRVSLVQYAGANALCYDIDRSLRMHFAIC